MRAAWLRNPNQVRNQLSHFQHFVVPFFTTCVMRSCKVYNLQKVSGLTNYATAWRYQKLLMEHSWQMKKAGTPVGDSLIVVEHPSTYTLGRGATLENVKFSTGNHDAPLLYRVERGGEVTWHGPGQLVVYPVFDLNHHKRDLHWFASSLEQCVINALQQYSITAGRSPVNTGVWVNGSKICALGVTASRWITMHGIAVNVNSELKHFQRIVPCGIDPTKGGVCRLQDLSNGEVSMEGFTNVLLKSFSDIFNLDLSTEQHPVEVIEGLANLYPSVASMMLESASSN